VVNEILLASRSTGKRFWFIDPEDQGNLGYLADPEDGYESDEFFINPTGFIRRIVNASEEDIEEQLDRQYVFCREMGMDEYEANREVEKAERKLRKRLEKLRDLFRRYPDLEVVYYNIGNWRKGWVNPVYKRLFG